MPPAIAPPRGTLSKFPSKRSNFQQQHSKSTYQDASGAKADELMSAILHGRQDPNNRSEQGGLSREQNKRPLPAPNEASESQNSKQVRRIKNAPKLAAGRKRKAQESLQFSTSVRQRIDPPPPQIHNPSLAQQKDLPPRVLEAPKSVLRDSLRGIYNFKPRFSSSGRQGFRCQLRCSPLDGGKPSITEGQGPNMKSAENAASLAMIVKLKDTDIMKVKLELISVGKLDDRTRQEEKNSKLDIYNYAARFDAVPEISHRFLLGSSRLRMSKMYEVTVKLPAQNIEVFGRGRDLGSAEIIASLRFREAAQRYQAEHGDKSLVIRDSSALTTDNCSQFFEYYKIRNPEVSIELTRPLKEGENQALLERQGIHRAQVNINGAAVGQSVSMSTRKQADNLAYLTAALEIRKQDPELFPGFVQALAFGNGKILKPIAPVTMSMDEDCQLVMRETLLSARKAGLPDEVEEVFTDEQQTDTRQRVFRQQLSSPQLRERDHGLRRAFSVWLTDPQLAEIRRKREELPMNQYRTQVLTQISNSIYSIVVGATGSGKTTQVPQIVLDDAITKGCGGSCNIICTQPRRIAATSVARRVADERGQSLQDSVGYHVRFDPKLPKHGGSITYCTTGIFLQQLQNQPDAVFESTSHIVIDEVHERDMMIDFLMIVIKRAIADRVAAGKSIPKVVLMSATMDTELFAGYFGTAVEGQGSTPCPSISVPGRTFPVKEIYLEQISNEIQKAHPQMVMPLLMQDPATKEYIRIEDEFRKQNPTHRKDATPDSASSNEFVIDWKTERKVTATGETNVATDKDDARVPIGLVATTIAHITKTTNEGAILVFLPGLDEMLKVEELLHGQPLGVNFREKDTFRVYLLHSSQPAAQREVFDQVPSGCRKIILSTNIAETSITIPDVQHVVDTGKLREKQYDQVRRITQLKCTWISKSNSKQRAGRAGRVQNGNYYALFSAERYASLRAVGLPEMLRSDLQEVCLAIKAQAFKYPIRQFLAEALEPPSSVSVDASIRNLHALDALTDDEQITPLGRLLASLPVHPSLGKMIVLGVIFRCLDPMLVLGAAAAERNIFVTPLDNRKAANDAKIGFVRGTGSDHIALLNAVGEMRRMRDTRGEYAMRRYAFENFIHVNSFKTIDATAAQIEELLVTARLIPKTPPHMRQRSEYGDPALNENSSKIPLIKSLAIAGFRPNLAVCTGSLTHRTPGEASTLLHPSSVNFCSPKDKDKDKKPLQTLYAYSSMSRSNDGNAIFLRDTTECTPLMATLFGGKLALRNGNMLEMDGWLPFFVRCDDSQKMASFGSFARFAKTVLELRKALERLLMGAFMDLGNARAKFSNRELGARGSILADDRVRRIFGQGLVEVLARDVKVAEATARRG
ncbi:MAG: hypothetical protein LQ352_004221, partial [Teloschistes flavicans]